ncbi:serine hydrolase domain-containing protein [Burkholderia multivorans]|uniref:serine hydrolase domain-containing protein n=1 Tax=Burkholderia multivorans TaxID=87883 RepID=UPI000CFF2486|nr:serine hydrolase [Burkholderia multivorans]MBU9163760.1 beta-lactamase family protein [Burkholderia multivorans]MBU9263386.1 beta-lactamase family protein [Burkholderia multivorans]PRF71543.1 6-aminohexanoate hydrolase [Burkholderia multivorans]
MRIHRRFTATRQGCRLFGSFALAGGLALAATVAAAADGVAPKGMMQGFPPAPDRIVDKANAFTPARLRWALSNTRLLVPTAGIRHAAVPMPLPEQPVPGLDVLPLTIGGETLTLDAYLRATHTDGFIVLQRGRVVYERYFDGFRPGQQHAWASMTKSVTGLLAAQMIESGVLDAGVPLSRTVPELADTPFGSATLQQNLDMEVPTAYAPGIPPDLGLFGAVGLVPRREGAPASIAEFLQSVRRVPDVAPGSVWFYQNGSPEAVAWAMQRGTGQSWSELVERWLWRDFAEDDAYVTVDRNAMAMASGGLYTTLRDAARFAERVRAGLGGAPGILQSAAIRAALRPANNAALFAAGNVVPGKDGYAYRDYWYQVNDGDGSFAAAGRFGQSILVDPKAALTIVKFSSSPDFAPRALDAQGEATRPRAALERADALSAVARAVAARLR